MDDLTIDLVSKATVQANHDAQLYGKKLRELKHVMSGGPGKLDLYLGQKNAKPLIPVHNKLTPGASKMLENDEADLGFAYRHGVPPPGGCGVPGRDLLLEICQNHSSSAMNWAHDAVLKKGMVKFIIHIDGWTHHPAHHGKDESISASEHAKRKSMVIHVTEPVVVAPNNPKTMQITLITLTT